MLGSLSQAVSPPGAKTVAKAAPCSPEKREQGEGRTRPHQWAAVPAGIEENPQPKADAPTQTRSLNSNTTTYTYMLRCTATQAQVLRSRSHTPLATYLRGPHTPRHTRGASAPQHLRTRARAHTSTMLLSPRPQPRPTPAIAPGRTPIAAAALHHAEPPNPVHTTHRRPAPHSRAPNVNPRDTIPPQARQAPGQGGICSRDAPGHSRPAAPGPVMRKRPYRRSERTATCQGAERGGGWGQAHGQAALPPSRVSGVSLRTHHTHANTQVFL